MGATVEAAAEDYGIRPLRDLLGELDRGFSDLGAGVGEEEGVDCSRRQLGQLGRQWLKQIMLVDVNLGVNEPLGLPGDGRDDPWVGVTGGVDGFPAPALSTLTTGRGDPTATSADHLQRRNREPHIGEMSNLPHTGMLRLSARAVETWKNLRRTGRRAGK